MSTRYLVKAGEELAALLIFERKSVRGVKFGLAAVDHFATNDREKAKRQ